jgi:hypothetical protein
VNIGSDHILVSNDAPNTKVQYSKYEYSYSGLAYLLVKKIIRSMNILFLSEIISKIFGFLIDLLLWVYVFVVNMFPLMSSMVYLFLMLFFHVV